MEYRHAFTVEAPIATVQDFHSRSAALRLITPPPVFVQLHQGPQVLGEGSEMEFTLWMGPLPVRWRSRIENVSPQGFDDRQIHGPFDAWTHHHSFVRVDEATTEIRDRVVARLHRNPFWWMVGFFMWLNLPLLFAFRSWKTRQVLHSVRP